MPRTLPAFAWKERTMKETPVIGVVGAGQMGRGIAQVAAQAGCEVHLMDSSEPQIGLALAAIGKDLKRLVSKGKLDDAESERILARIQGTARMGDLGQCEYVIEA